MPPERRTTLAGVAVFCLSVLFYGCLVDRGFVYDDFIVIKKERPLAGAADVARIFREQHYEFRPYYRPVTRLTFAAQQTLHGDERALPYHVVNAVLAGCLALATWGLFRRPAFEIDGRAAALGALLFAVHPIAASCVFPAASGRETLLPTVLMVASLDLHLRGGWGHRLLAALGLTLALFAKESAVVLVPMFLLADLLHLSQEPAPGARRLARRYALLLLPVAVYLAVRWTIFRGSEYALQDDARFFLATPVYALQTALLPFLEPVYEPVYFSDWLSPARLALVSVVLVLAALALRRRRPERRAALFWCGIFFLGLLPTANLLRQDAPYCERYVLLSLVALVGLACTLASAGRRAPDAGFLRGPAGIVALTALAASCAVSVRYASVYADNLSFCEQWARTSPHHYLPHYNLARALEDAGRDAEAERSYLRSLELDPEWQSSLTNLGSLYLRTGRPDQALRCFERWRALAPDSARAHYSVGVAHLHLDQLAPAVAALGRAVELDPGSAEAHHNLGVACARSGDLGRARSHLEEALRLEPGKENSRESLALVLEQLGGD